MIIIHVLEPFATGVTTAVSSIARELPDFTHIVVHGSRNWTESTDNIKKRFPAGVSFVDWKHAAREISLSGDLKALRSLMAILKSYTQKNLKNNEQIVVHLHSSKAGFLGRLTCFLLGIKAVIYTPHCGAFLRTDISTIKRKLYRSFEWIGGIFGGRVVGCGASEAELYKKLGKNTTYVSNGVAINKEQITRNRENSRNLISFTGIASFQKDPDMWSAVASACAGTAREEGFSFCWIGDGPEAGELKEAASQNKDSIILTGWKNAKEVGELLNKTALFFSAAAWEGLPYGVLEAMASGCALLLRNVPGNRELVIPGGNGLLFNTKEEASGCIKTMLKDRALLAAMGKRSLEIAERDYSLKQMGEGYRKIYSSYIKR